MYIYTYISIYIYMYIINHDIDLGGISLTQYITFVMQCIIIDIVMNMKSLIRYSTLTV